MENQAPLELQRGALPAQFFLQVKEGMARFDVPTEENLKTLLSYCEDNGYRVEWTGSAAAGSELAQELLGFPGGRYVAHLMPSQVLEPGWAGPPAEAMAQGTQA